MFNYKVQREEYGDNQWRWKKVKDCVSLNVKKVDWGYVMKKSQYSYPTASDYYHNELYLPYPTNESSLERNHDRYIKYIQRAIFVGYTKRTHDGMIGMVYRKPTEIELPPVMDAWQEDATGTGLSLNQLSKNLLSETSQTGFSALYTTYPRNDDQLSAEDTANVLPEIKLYDAESITYWSDDDRLIILCETYNENELSEGIDDVKKEQYRVLRLEDGVATSQVYRDGQEFEKIELIDGNGQTFDYIPLRWCGTVNNDNKPDESLLESIADLNIGHYRNSADLEENCFIHGQGTMFLSGDISIQDFKEANPNGVQVGSNQGHHLGANGNAILLQAEPNQIADKLMERKENQMLQLGASLISDKSVKTATEASITAATESSNLVSLVDNVESCIRKAVVDAARYLGVEIKEDDFTFKLNREFYPVEVTPQEVMAHIQLYDRGVIGNEELRMPLRTVGKIERSDEEIDEEVVSRGIQ